MTISNTTVKTSAVGGVTNYTFAFRVLADTDLKVYTEDSDGVLTLKTLNTDYTVTFVTGVEGGTVIFSVAPSASLNVWIIRVTPETQATDYEKNKSIPAEEVETAQDKLTMLVNQLQDEVDRSLRVEFTGSLAEPSLPVPEAGKYLTWNSTEDGISNVTLPSASFSASDTRSGTATPSGVTLATLTLPDNSGAHVHVFGVGLISTDQDIFNLEVMLNRTTGTTTITAINQTGGIFTGYLTAEQSGNNVVINAYSASSWAVDVVLNVLSGDTITIV